MGPLQPGLPSSTMFPRQWKFAILDVKDCFFNIPLHPHDAPRFAFSVPSLNRQAPLRRSIILHYMDDVLICAPDDTYLNLTLEKTIQAIEKAGFEIQQEKILRTCPWTYLGLHIGERTVVPQQLTIRDDPRTLRDLHQLCGSINWVCPLLGVKTEDLAPLFNLLKGCEDLDLPRVITEEARESIEKVQLALSSHQAHRTSSKLPFSFIILGKLPKLHGLIFPWDTDQKDPLLIIGWIFLSHQPFKTITTPQELMAQLIMRARARLHTLTGCYFTCIYLPLKTGVLEYLLQTNEHLQFALDSYPGKVSIHNPKHKLCDWAFHLAPKELQSQTPLKALTVFTDGSGGSHKSVMTWNDPRTQMWESDVQMVEGSPQIAELAAMVRVFERFEEPINLVTDSAYVVGVITRAEHALLKEVPNPKLYSLLSKIVFLLSHGKHPFHVMRGHTPIS
ncbi:POK11 protein, partial [Pachycephala philippinensis]|nr:POK11 protein [Pachycephala philippinensis]